MALIKNDPSSKDGISVHLPVNARQGNGNDPAQQDAEERNVLIELKRFFDENGFPMHNPRKRGGTGYYIGGTLRRIPGNDPRVINGRWADLYFTLETKHGAAGYHLLNEVKIGTDDDTIQEIGNFAGRFPKIQESCPSATWNLAPINRRMAFIHIPVTNHTTEVLRILRDIITPIFNL